MDREKVKRILIFFKDIDNQVAMNGRIVNDLEEKYYTLSGGGGLDGMPRGKKITKPTEAVALNIPESASETIRELKAENKALAGLKAAINREIARLPYPQRAIIFDFYVHGFQWVRISQRLSYSERQCKNIRNSAIDKLGRQFSQNKRIAAYNYPA